MVTRKGFLIAGVVALGLVVLSIGGFGYLTYDYVQSNPAFCASCHIMKSAWVKWAQSPHKNITCHSCHEQSEMDSARLLIKWVTLHPDQVKTHAVVSEQRCIKCHLSKDKRWPQIANTAGHKVHFVEAGIPCLTCHGQGIHKFIPPAEICQKCHSNVVVKVKGMAKLHCTTCHNYLARDGNLAQPTRKDCLECHKTMKVKSEVFPANAPMLFPCGVCHKPHSRPLPTRQDCLSCHPQAQLVGLHQKTAHADCVTCHQPHAWKVTSRSTCEVCHVDRKNHFRSSPCFQCHRFGGGPIKGKKAENAGGGKVWGKVEGHLAVGG